MFVGRGRKPSNQKFESCLLGSSAVVPKRGAQTDRTSLSDLWSAEQNGGAVGDADKEGLDKEKKNCISQTHLPATISYPLNSLFPTVIMCFRYPYE